VTERLLVGFHGVALGYGRRPFLSELDFAVHRGDFVGIVGPNGSGKTTILRGILGLLRPLSGEIRFDGGRGRERFHIGYVPQRETLDETFPLAALDVVLMGRYRRAGRSPVIGSEHREAAKRALTDVGMGDRIHVPFRDLSGGQKQRTLIARALAAEADMLVLDEPTSGMDLRAEHDVMSLVASLHRERGLTVVMVSHQLNTVANWVKRLGLLHDGELDLGPVDEMLTSETLSRVYGPGAAVGTVEGQRVVLPPRGSD
jgi:ABC-type Mn2+/Zn2+ transport system ATPase subunit